MDLPPHLHTDLEGGHGDQQHETGHDEWEDLKGILLPVAAQTAQTDSEKARQQHEIREVADIENIRRGPADHGQLEEQNQKAQPEKPFVLRFPG